MKVRKKMMRCRKPLLLYDKEQPPWDAVDEFPDRQSIPSTIGGLLQCPVFVINLEKDVYRYLYALRNIQEAGFTNIQRFAGISSLQQEYITRNHICLDAKNILSQSLGRQGCLLSHFLLWKYMIEKEIPCAVIFEDDVIFHKDWKTLAEHYYTNTSKNFDYLYLGSSFLLDDSQKEIDKVPVYNTHAMVMTLEGAKKWVSVFENSIIYDALDIFLCKISARYQKHFHWYVWNLIDTRYIGTFDPNFNGLVYQNTSFPSNTYIQGNIELGVANQCPSTFTKLLQCPCKVINLDRNPERWESTRKRLQEAGFTYVERFSAVDATNEKELKKAWDDVGNPPFSSINDGFQKFRGTQGCFLSHVLIWKEVLSRKIPCIVVMEDDILFHPRWKEIAPLYYDKTPKDFDVLYMGGRNACENSRHFEKHNQLVVKCPVGCTHAMVLTYDGVRKLWDLFFTNNKSGGVCAIDVLLCDLMKKQTNPTLFTWYVWNARKNHPAKLQVNMNEEWVHRNAGLVFQDEVFGTEINV